MHGRAIDLKYATIRVVLRLRRWTQADYARKHDQLSEVCTNICQEKSTRFCCGPSIAAGSARQRDRHPDDHAACSIAPPRRPSPVSEPRFLRRGPKRLRCRLQDAGAREISVCWRHVEARVGDGIDLSGRHIQVLPQAE